MIMKSLLIKMTTMITFHFQDDEQINEIARFSRRLK